MTLRLDPAALLHRRFEPITHDYDTRDTMLYALAIGIAADPLEPAALPYVFEGVDGGGPRVVPTMANVLAYPGFWAREPDTGIDWRRVVHAEQAITLAGPLPPCGRVVGRTRVTGLWDRGPDRGAFMEQQREIRDAATGRLLASVTQRSLLRGDGGFGAGGSDGSPPAPHVRPQRMPDAVCELPTMPQAALLYRLCGDRNPLHADPDTALAAGFERPILHGMATMGVAAYAVLRTLLAHDTRRFAGMRVRFTAPAWPGDTLRTEMWTDDDVVSLRTTAVERGVVVLDHARVDLRS